MIPPFAFMPLFSGGGALTNPMTNPGDLIVGGSGGAPTRLAIGASDGMVPTVQSGALVYQTPSGTAGMTRIAQVKVTGSPASTISFSSIPGTYTDLILTIQGRDTSGSISGGGCSIQLNGDTTSGNYTSGYGYKNINGGAYGTLGGGPTSGGSPFCGIPGTSGNANAIGVGKLLIANYANTSFYKILRSEYCYYYGSTPNIEVGDFGIVYKSNSAISSILLTPPGTSFAVGTEAILYGIG